MKAVFGPQWLFPPLVSLGAEKGYIPPQITPNQLPLPFGFAALQSRDGQGLQTHSQAVSLPASTTPCANTEEL